MESNNQSQEQKSNGALVGSIIIVIILIIGGIYFWQTSVKGKIKPALPDQNIGSTQNVSDNLDSKI